MCMICRATGSDVGAVKAADDFLTAFEAASKAMKRAETALLHAANLMPEDVDRRRYRRLQKTLARMRRDWNRTEHTREIGGDAAFAAPAF